MEYSLKNAGKSIPDYIGMPFCILKQWRNEQALAIISEKKYINNLFLCISDAKYTEQLCDEAVIMRFKDIIVLQNLWKHRTRKPWGKTIISGYNFGIIYKLGEVLLYDKIQNVYSREVYKKALYQGK